MLAISHTPQQYKAQVKAAHLFTASNDSFMAPSNIRFYALYWRARREFEKAEAQERAFDLDFIGFAVLRYYNEFKDALELPYLSPMGLKKFLNVFHHTPHDPRGEKAICQF